MTGTEYVPVFLDTNDSEQKFTFYYYFYFTKLKISNN